MAEDEGPLVAGVDRIEAVSEGIEPVGPLDPVEIIDPGAVVESVRGPLGPVTASSSAPAVVIGDLVRGDPEEPGSESAGTPLESVEAPERPLERRGGEILGQFTIAASAIREGMDPFGVAAVELGEAVGVHTRPFDERTLVEQITVVLVVHRPPT